MRITLLMPLALVALAGSSLQAMKPASTPSTPATGRAAAAKDKVEAVVVDGLKELETVASNVGDSPFAAAFKAKHPNIVAAIPLQHLAAVLRVLEAKHPTLIPTAHARGLNVSSEAAAAVSEIANLKSELSASSATLDAFGEVVQGLTGVSLPAVGTQAGNDLQMLIQSAVAAGLANLDQYASSGCGGKKAVKK